MNIALQPEIGHNCPGIKKAELKFFKNRKIEKFPLIANVKKKFNQVNGLPLIQ